MSTEKVRSSKDKPTAAQKHRWGDNLRALMDHFQMNQETLANYCGSNYKAASVSNWCSGDHLPVNLVRERIYFLFDETESKMLNHTLTDKELEAKDPEKIAERLTQRGSALENFDGTSAPLINSGRREKKIWETFRSLMASKDGEIVDHLRNQLALLLELLQHRRKNP